MLIDQKVIERPESREDYVGTVIDVVDWVADQPKYGKKDVPLMKIVWVINANDSEGKPFRVSSRPMTRKLHEKSHLYEAARRILGTDPTVPFETEDLMGRSNRLEIERVVVQTDKGPRVYANVVAIRKLPVGVIPPVAPPDFVRAKDRPAEQGYRSYAPVVTTVVPAAQAAKAPVPPVAQPAPKPQPVAAPLADDTEIQF